MSGVVSIGAAVIATTLAVEAVATVGITVGTAFAIAGAVGAAAAAVGTIAKIPELKMAGMALGAVGGIGSIASAAGVFGSSAAEGMFFGANVAGDAAAGGGWATGGVAGELGSAMGAAGDAVSFMSPVAPWTPETLAAATNGLGEGMTMADAGLAGFGQGVDVTSMVNGMGQVAPPPTGQVQVPTGVPQPVEPFADTLMQVDSGLPKFERLISDFDLGVAPAGGPAIPGTNQSLLNQGIPRDEFGNILSQGGDPVGAQIGPGVSNPDQVQGVVPAPTQTAAQGTPPPTPTPQAPVTGTNTTIPTIGTSPGAPQIGSGTMNMAQPSTFSKILDFAGKNPSLMFGALQAGGSFLSGAFGGGLKPEQAAALEAQAEQNRAAARLYDQQQQMLQQRQANLSRVPVAKRTSLLNQGSGGISPGPLNSPVTGVPA